MIVGDYWAHKSNPNSVIKLMQFLGDDLWSCRNVINGGDDDLFGGYIYQNYTKVEDPKKIQAYENDLNNFNKLIKRLTNKTMKKQKEKK